MSTKVGGILVEMGANVARLQKDFDEAKRVVGRGAADIQRTMAAARTALGTLGVGLSFGAIVGGFKSLVDGIDDLAESAQGLQTTAVALSEMRTAARAFGVDGETLSTGINRLNNLISDASAGSKDAQATFRALGVSFRDAQGNARGTEEVLADIAASFARHADGAEKSALANDLFGKSGYRMVAWLNQGAGALKESSGLTQEAVKEAEKLRGEWDKLAVSFERAKNQLLGGLLPALNSLAGFWERNAKAKRDLDPSSFAWMIGPGLGLGIDARQKAREDFRQRQAALAGAGEIGDRPIRDPNAPLRDRFGGRGGFGAAGRTEALPAAVEAARLYEQTMQRLAGVLANVNELSFTEQENLRLVRGEYGPLTDLVRDEIMQRARAADILQEQLKAQKEIAAAQEQEKRDLADLTKLMEDYAGITEDLRKQRETAFLERQLAAGVAYTPEQLEAIVKGIARIKDESAAASNDVERLGLQMVSSLGDWIKEPTGGWKSLFKALGQDVQQLMVQLLIMEPLARQMKEMFKSTAGGGSSGSWLEAAGSIFGSLFGLAGGGGTPNVETYTGGVEWRARGGPALAGRPYIVGEQGPELFVPRTSGQVVANGALGGTAITFAPSISIDSRSDRAAVAADVDRAMRASEARLLDSMRRGGAMYQGA